MGFHSYLQRKSVPFESALATSANHRIFKFIKERANEQTRRLAYEHGCVRNGVNHPYDSRHDLDPDILDRIFTSGCYLDMSDFEESVKVEGENGEIKTYSPHDKVKIQRGTEKLDTYAELLEEGDIIL